MKLSIFTNELIIIYRQIEVSAREDDLGRPAVKLARALHRQGFPLVSVLDGG